MSPALRLLLCPTAYLAQHQAEEIKLFKIQLNSSNVREQAHEDG
jgi:hypothetical protein